MLLPQPYSSPCLCLWHSQKPNRGPELVQLFLRPYFGASVTRNEHSVNNPARTGVCQSYAGTCISVSVK